MVTLPVRDGELVEISKICKVLSVLLFTYAYLPCTNTDSGVLEAAMLPTNLMFDPLEVDAIRLEILPITVKASFGVDVPIPT